MKYLTKEYYALIDASALQYDLVASPSAKRKSENYFQHLYQQRFKVWLDTKHQQAEEHHLPWDEAAETEAFQAGYQKKLRDCSAILPREILEQVADIRVLALGRCSGKVKQLVGRFCREQDEKADKLLTAYEEYWERRSRHFPDHILENYGFDYCVVTAIGRDGDNVVMTLDNTGCYDDVNTVIWKNAEILELEDGVVGGRWMDHELYQVSGGYEFHSILEGENGQLCYLTLKAEDVSFIFDEKKREASEEAE